ncbi:MAG: PH domain-containing protein [Anaerolineae bacterium]
MFKNLASTALGTSDIGTVVKPADYDKVESDDFVMHEDGEKIFFLIKSKTDEYCFTNRAMIHVDGTSAMSKKRTLRRYDYYAFAIGNVMLETAGNLDRDIEIKFTMGQQDYSIDVDKKHLEELKDLYKALLKIGQMQHENGQYLQYARKSLEAASATVNRAAGDTSLEEQFKAINQYAFTWLRQTHDTYVAKDYGAVFEKYIKN